MLNNICGDVMNDLLTCLCILLSSEINVFWVIYTHEQHLFSGNYIGVLCVVA